MILMVYVLSIMIHSRFLVLFTAFIALSLLLPAVPVGASTPKTAAFHSKEFGFSIKYPVSWIVLPQDDGVLLVIQSPDEKSAISVGASFAEGPVDISKITNQFIEEQNSALKVLKTRSKKIKGMSAKEFLTTQVSDGETLKGKQVWIANGKAIYILAYASSKNTYAKALRVFDSFVRSFTVKKKGK
ncbi:hypothetical protein A2789_01160 [Candidatus Peribacteria bacterium RIFCSPHIGHO2_01_FULL_54_22]|nr:MAG: hypothetical protein A2789_01160 [Candidatus Peribacteria bacterium RIFCSPHIGHO2_01_FULL_54_22]OGJ63723.1 MAG: hypothetical protein A3D12_03170 [Candidatus Peribacteria bacterium RIFCSPHIGHO2_02_FULL_55_24]